MQLDLSHMVMLETWQTKSPKDKENTMDLADKGLLMHLMGNYKWEIQNKIDNPRPGSTVYGSIESRELSRLNLEMEMIERASEIIQDIP